MIDELLSSGITAEKRNYSAGDIIFSSGEETQYYYIILQGAVKLINVNGTPKEFIQEIRWENQGIAEFTLFVDEPYPFTAIAIADCMLISFPKHDLISLIKDRPEMNLYFLRKLSESIHQEFLTKDIYLENDNCDKVRLLLNYLKRKHTDSTPYSFSISLTKLEIAGMTGLSMQKVSTTIKKMEKEKLLKIVDHKIFY